jgi:hypothetical protein
MKSMFRIAVFTFVMVSPVLLAQDKPQNKPQPKPAAPTAVVPAKSEPVATPTPQQSFQLGRLSAQMEALQTQYSQLVQQILQEHPGFQWDPRSASLVAAPKPAPKAEAK